MMNPDMLVDPPLLGQREGWLLHYQPLADLRTGRVMGVEALIRRMKPPLRKVSFPDEFIPAAEETGLISPLTRYVLNEALRQLRKWQEGGLRLGVAVNLSVKNLQDFGLVDDLARLLQEWDVEPDRLALEITESALMADPDGALTMLSRLAAMGVRLALDDFGTGYSSLAHLRELPVDQIKIDKSFVINMPESETDAKIVRSTIELGRSLGLEVIAEGVETEDVYRQLAGLGCHIAQGYFLSRPIPPAELAEWVAAREESGDIPAASFPGAVGRVPRRGTGAPATRVMVVEDHTLVRQTLVKVLGMEPGFHVVGEAGRADEAVEVARRASPDVVLMDIELPGGDGLGVAGELKHVLPEARVLFLTMRDDNATIRRAIGVGAAGYLPKTVPTEELLQAVRTVAGGGSYLSPSVARRVVGMASQPAPSTGVLSSREAEVLGLLATGQRSSQIAAQLGVAVKTVKNTLTSVYAKLGVGGAAEAIVEAARLGVAGLGGSNGQDPAGTSGT